MFLKNLRAPIQRNTTYVVVPFSLIHKGEFLYSPYHKKQGLITYHITRIKAILGKVEDESWGFFCSV